MGRPWFEPKTQGIGATPSTWEGWLATLIFILISLATASLADPRPDGLGYVLGVRRLPVLHDLVMPVPAVLVLILVEAGVFTYVAWLKSSGPWLRR